MRPWVRESVQWIGVAFLLSMSMYWFLFIGSGLPRPTAVSFAAACERAIPGFPVFVFVSVCTIGAIFVVLHEWMRRAFGDSARHHRRD